MSHKVYFRQAMEKVICRKILTEGVAAGYCFTIDDGDTEEGHEIYNHSIDVDGMMKELFNLDDAHIWVHDGEKQLGWIRIIFGNSGWDCISDYRTSLDDFLKPINDMAEKFDEDPVTAIEEAAILRAKESPEFKKRLLEVINK